MQDLNFGIRTQRGPLTPTPLPFSSAETRVCGFLKHTKVYWPVYNAHEERLLASASARGV
jgi:hypothetical protein